MRKTILIVTATVLCLAFSVPALLHVAAQNRETNRNRKQTTNGFEVTLLDVKPATERDSLNNVVTYRYGSCPPGVVLDGVKVLAESGRDVLIARLEFKVLKSYGNAKISLPVLVDANGKKFASRNTMLSDSLSELLQRLRGKDDQLQCEFPFEVPTGTRMTKLQYDELSFEVGTPENR